MGEFFGEQCPTRWCVQCHDCYTAPVSESLDNQPINRLIYCLGCITISWKFCLAIVNGQAAVKAKCWTSGNFKKYKDFQSYLTVNQK